METFLQRLLRQSLQQLRKLTIRKENAGTDSKVINKFAQEDLKKSVA